MFGCMSDRVGRVKVLAITIWLMALGTAVIGMLPTHASIGLAAPVLLVVCRLCQGLAMGGETTGSTSFVLESAPKHNRGRWVGVIFAFATLPNAVVAVMLLGLQLLVGKETYLDWAWRVPFLVGGLIGVVGYWLRRNLDDPEEYKAARKSEFQNPLRAVSKTGFKSMLYVAMIQPVQTVSAYLLIGFMYTFLVKQAGVDSRVALFSNALAIFAYAVFIPIGGHLSDRYGRKPVLSFGALWIAVFAYFSIRMASVGTLPELFIGQILIAIGAGIYSGPCFAAAPEFFPTSFRATGHAIAYQTVVAALGGTTPLICAWLVNSSGSPLAPGWYVTFIAILCFILVRFVPETKDVDLSTSVDTSAAKSATLKAGAAIARR